MIFPLRVIHVIPMEKKSKKQFDKEGKQLENLPENVQTKVRSEQGVKRNRNQAQKSVRSKYQPAGGARKKG